MRVELYARTNGKGLWSRAAQEVKVVKIKFDYIAEADTPKDVAGSYATFRAYFDPKTWKVARDGLIYTDPLWIRDFRLGLQDLGLAHHAKEVDYTEQGMQGNNFVSLNIGGGVSRAEQLRGARATNALRELGVGLMTNPRW